jgi:hypothetical protein
VALVELPEALQQCEDEHRRDDSESDQGYVFGGALLIRLQLHPPVVAAANYKVRIPDHDHLAAHHQFHFPEVPIRLVQLGKGSGDGHDHVGKEDDVHPNASLRLPGSAGHLLLVMLSAFGVIGR